MGKLEYNLPGTWWRKTFFRHLDYVINSKSLPKYVGVYGHAKKIDMSSGELFPDFYNNSKFLENIEASAENGAEIKVLFGPALRVESDKFLEFTKRYDNVKLFCRNKRESSHIKVIEDIEGGMFALVDGPHDPYRTSTTTLILTNDDFKSIIFPLEDILKGQITNSNPVDKEQLIERFASEREANGEFRGFIHEDKTGRILPATDEQIERLKLSYQA